MDEKISIEIIYIKQKKFVDVGCIIKNKSSRWTNGKIPYTIDDNDFPDDGEPTTTNARDMINAAIIHWNTFTPIRLVNRDNEKDYVSFKIAASCSSPVGRQKGEQSISCDVGNGFNTGNVIHEIGHAVGFYHEQSRADRDNFIAVDQDNLTDRGKSNFQERKNALLPNPYDYGSIMHYPAFLSSTMVNDTTKSAFKILKLFAGIVGQRNSLSSGDISAVRYIYSRYMGNTNSTEVHDSANRHTNCQISEILDTNRIYFGTRLEDAHHDRFDNCHYCLGNSHR